MRNVATLNPLLVSSDLCQCRPDEWSSIYLTMYEAVKSQRHFFVHVEALVSLTQMPNSC